MRARGATEDTFIYLFNYYLLLRTRVARAPAENQSGTVKDDTGRAGAVRAGGLGWSRRGVMNQMNEGERKGR